MIEERIRQLLAARQLSPTQFADTIGISRPIISHILSGRNKPSLEVVQKIVAAFPDLSLPWLLSGAGEMLAATPGLSAEAASVRPPKTKHATGPILDQRKPVAAPKSDSIHSSEMSAPVVQEVVPTLVAQEASSPPALAPSALASVATEAVRSESVPIGLPDKRIRRIVIFYQDGTFSDFQPEPGA